MSSKSKRRVTVDTGNTVSEDSEKRKPSVFERLGPGAGQRKYSDYENAERERKCRPFLLTGECPYGSTCKYKHVQLSRKSRTREDEQSPENLRLKLKSSQSSAEKRRGDSDTETADSQGRASGGRSRRDKEGDAGERSSSSHSRRDKEGGEGGVEPRSLSHSRREKETKLKSQVVVKKSSGNQDTDDSGDDSESNWLNSLDYKKELELEQERQQLQRELSQLAEEEVPLPLSDSDSSPDADRSSKQPSLTMREKRSASPAGRGKKEKKKHRTKSPPDMPAKDKKGSSPLPDKPRDHKKKHEAEDDSHKKHKKKKDKRRSPSPSHPEVRVKRRSMSPHHLDMKGKRRSLSPAHPEGKGKKKERGLDNLEGGPTRLHQQDGGLGSGLGSQLGSRQHFHHQQHHSSKRSRSSSSDSSASPPRSSSKDGGKVKVKGSRKKKNRAGKGGVGGGGGGGGGGGDTGGGSGSDDDSRQSKSKKWLSPLKKTLKLKKTKPAGGSVGSSDLKDDDDRGKRRSDSPHRDSRDLLAEDPMPPSRSIDTKRDWETARPPGGGHASDKRDKKHKAKRSESPSVTGGSDRGAGDRGGGGGGSRTSSRSREPGLDRKGRHSESPRTDRGGKRGGGGDHPPPPPPYDRRKWEQEKERKGGGDEGRQKRLGSPPSSSSRPTEIYSPSQLDRQSSPLTDASGARGHLRGGDVRDDDRGRGTTSRDGRRGDSKVDPRTQTPPRPDRSGQDRYGRRGDGGDSFDQYGPPDRGGAGRFDPERSSRDGRGQGQDDSREQQRGRSGRGEHLDRTLPARGRAGNRVEGGGGGMGRDASFDRSSPSQRLATGGRDGSRDMDSRDRSREATRDRGDNRDARDREGRGSMGEGGKFGSSPFGAEGLRRSSQWEGGSRSGDWSGDRADPSRDLVGGRMDERGGRMFRDDGRDATRAGGGDRRGRDLTSDPHSRSSALDRGGDSRMDRSEAGAAGRMERGDSVRSSDRGDNHRLDRDRDRGDGRMERGGEGRPDRGEGRLDRPGGDRMGDRGDGRMDVRGGVGDGGRMDRGDNRMDRGDRDRGGDGGSRGDNSRMDRGDGRMDRSRGGVDQPMVGAGMDQRGARQGQGRGGAAGPGDGRGGGSGGMRGGVVDGRSPIDNRVFDYDRRGGGGGSAHDPMSDLPPRGSGSARAAAAAAAAAAERDLLRMSDRDRDRDLPPGMGAPPPPLPPPPSRGDRFEPLSPMHPVPGDFRRDDPRAMFMRDDLHLLSPEAAAALREHERERERERYLGLGLAEARGDPLMRGMRRLDDPMRDDRMSAGGARGGPPPPPLPVVDDRRDRDRMLPRRMGGGMYGDFDRPPGADLRPLPPEVLPPSQRRGPLLPTPDDLPPVARRGAGAGGGVGGSSRGEVYERDGRAPRDGGGGGAGAGSNSRDVRDDRGRRDPRDADFPADRGGGGGGGVGRDDRGGGRRDQRDADFAPDLARGGGMGGGERDFPRDGGGGGRDPFTWERSDLGVKDGGPRDPQGGGGGGSRRGVRGSDDLPLVDPMDRGRERSRQDPLLPRRDNRDRSPRDNSSTRAKDGLLASDLDPSKRLLSGKREEGGVGGSGDRGADNRGREVARGDRDKLESSDARSTRSADDVRESAGQRGKDKVPEVGGRASSLRGGRDQDSQSDGRRSPGARGAKDRSPLTFPDRRQPLKRTRSLSPNKRRGPPGADNGNGRPPAGRLGSPGRRGGAGSMDLGPVVKVDGKTRSRTPVGTKRRMDEDARSPAMSRQQPGKDDTRSPATKRLREESRSPGRKGSRHASPAGSHHSRGSHTSSNVENRRRPGSAHREGPEGRFFGHAGRDRDSPGAWRDRDPGVAKPEKMGDGGKADSDKGDASRKRGRSPPARLLGRAPEAVDKARKRWKGEPLSPELEQAQQLGFFPSNIENKLSELVDKVRLSQLRNRSRNTKARKVVLDKRYERERLLCESDDLLIVYDFKRHSLFDWFIRKDRRRHRTHFEEDVQNCLTVWSPITEEKYLPACIMLSHTVIVLAGAVQHVLDGMWSDTDAAENVPDKEVPRPQKDQGRAGEGQGHTPDIGRPDSTKSPSAFTPVAAGSMPGEAAKPGRPGRSGDSFSSRSSLEDPTQGASQRGADRAEVRPGAAAEGDPQGDVSANQDAADDSKDAGLGNILYEDSYEKISSDESDFEAEEGEKQPSQNIVSVLDIDWASLAKEAPPKQTTGSLLKRFHPASIFSQIGISRSLAGPALFDKVKALCEEGVKVAGSAGKGDDKENAAEETAEKDTKDKGDNAEVTKPDAAPVDTSLQADVPVMHMSAVRQKRERANLLRNLGPFRRALCARRDLEIRRQLCKVDKVYEQPAVFPAHVMDADLCKLSIQLFRQGRDFVERKDSECDGKTELAV